MDSSRRSHTSKRSHTSSTDISESRSEAYSTDSKSLESLADSFQKELRRQNLIKDETINRKTITKAFAGSDAVTVILNLLPPYLSREDAVGKGNEMMAQFGFFKHATKPLDNQRLEDSPVEFYQFENNLQSQVHRAHRKYTTDWDIVRVLEENIEVKDRRYVFKTYPDSFVAREAVDVIMELKLTRTRREAVALMKLLNQSVRCCHHVLKEHDFKDEYLFFRFTPQEERIPEAVPNSRTGRRMTVPLMVETSTSCTLTAEPRLSVSPIRSSRGRKPDPDGVHAGEVY